MPVDPKVVDAILRHLCVTDQPTSASASGDGFAVPVPAASASAASRARRAPRLRCEFCPGTGEHPHQVRGTRDTRAFVHQHVQASRLVRQAAAGCQREIGQLSLVE